MTELDIEALNQMKLDAWAFDEVRISSAFAEAIIAALEDRDRLRTALERVPPLTRRTLGLDAALEGRDG